MSKWIFVSMLLCLRSLSACTAINITNFRCVRAAIEGVTRTQTRKKSQSHFINWELNHYCHVWHTTIFPTKNEFENTSLILDCRLMCCMQHMFYLSEESLKKRRERVKCFKDSCPKVLIALQFDSNQINRCDGGWFFIQISFV